MRQIKVIPINELMGFNAASISASPSGIYLIASAPYRYMDVANNRAHIVIGSNGMDVKVPLVPDIDMHATRIRIFALKGIPVACAFSLSRKESISKKTFHHSLECFFIQHHVYSLPSDESIIGLRTRIAPPIAGPVQKFSGEIPDLCKCDIFVLMRTGCQCKGR